MKSLANLYKHYPYWLLCLVTIGFVGLYWGFVASDRYVSESNIVLESPQITPPTLSFSSLLNGTGNGSRDMLLLRDYLLSVDMLRKVDKKLGFREHYANKEIDFFSRLYNRDSSIEELHDYYLSRIFIELDEYAQVLRIKVQAFSPEMANKITTLLLSEGEGHMNAMGQRLAEEQVRFLEKQLDKLSGTFDKARQALLDYQNANGLVSPTGTVESLNAVVSKLEGQLTDLKANRTVLASFQSKTSPEIVRINSQIDALKNQITQERARMAQQSGNALNAVSSEYQTLELRAQFAQESYSGALAALENTRIEAARKLKQVSILQSPTLPEYPIEPRRIYNTTAFTVIALFITLIIHLMISIIRDHVD